MSGNTWQVTGGGGGVGGGSDQFHFDYQTLVSSGTVTAQLQSQTQVPAYAPQGGVMIRSSTDPGAPFYYLFYSPNNGTLAVSYRLYAGAAAVGLVSNISVTVPLYLQVTRAKFTFTAQTSSDGTTWTPVSGSTVAIPMGNNVTAGLAVTSGCGCGSTTATFAASSVNPASSDPVTSCPAPWSCADLGTATGDPNGQAAIGGGATWALYTGNNDGAMRFAYQSFTASTAAVSAAVTSFTLAGAGNRAVAGVMLRESTASNARYYAAYVTQNGTVEVDQRDVVGGTEEHLCLASDGTTSWQTSGCSNPSYTLPQYLKVQRQGFVFTAYTSSDGQSWTEITGSSFMMDMGPTLAGPVAGLTAAGFDAVSVTSSGDPVQSCLGPWTCQKIQGTMGTFFPSDQNTVDGTSWALTGGGQLGTSPYTDSVEFVGQSVGSGSISAQVTGYYPTSNDPYGPNVGVMIRNSLDPAAAYYAVYVTPGGINVLYRAIDGGSYTTVVNNYPDPSGTPVSLAIVGGMGHYSAFYAPAGGGWTLISNSTIPDQSRNFPAAAIGASALGGMFAGGATQTALFTNIAVSAPTSPTTASILGGQGLSTFNTTCLTGSPINCDTGDFWHTFDDLSIPGRGLPLDFSQTYNSLLANQDSPLGYGWSDSYNMFLSQDASGNITVHEEGGSEIPFASSGTGTYVPPSWVFATLTQNQDGTLTFQRSQTQDKYIFSAPTSTAAGQLLKEVDPNGYATTLSYNGSGQLATVTDPAGRALTLSYNSSGRIATITDPANRTITFGYDSNGNLTSLTDAAANTTTFTYDGNHLLLTMTDPRHGVLTNVYDSSGRATQQTDPLNRVTKLTYTANSDGTQTTAITDPNGTVETEIYQNNELISDTYGTGTPQATTWQYTYDPATAGVTQVTDPNNHVWKATYDTSGNLLSQTDPLGRTTAYTYNSLNEVLTTVDPCGNLTSSPFCNGESSADAAGHTTTATYDANGNLLSVSAPIIQAGANKGTAQVQFIYGDSSHPGDVTGITDPNSHTTSFQYDSYGNLIKETDPLGNVTTATYDIVGRMLTVVDPCGNLTSAPFCNGESSADPAGHTTTIVPNAYGDPTSVTDPLDNVTTYQYDADENLQKVIDANSHATTYTYDLDNELTGETFADNSTYGFAYDANGNVLSQTNGLNNSTSYTYDPLNRVSTQTDPLHRITTYTYDGAGNLTSLVDAMNRTTTYGYDAANELTSITYSDGQTPNVSNITYTPDGLRSTMADGTGTSLYTYDSLNRLVSQTDGGGHTVSYGYDLAGNLTSLTYPDSTQVTRTYDAANELTDVKDWNGNETHFSYDPDGNLTSETFPSSTNTSASFTYNAADELTKIVDARSTGSNPFRWVFGYGRDPLGQVSASTDRSPGMRHSYSYDALNRLTRDATGNNTATTWGYDAARDLTMSGNKANNTSSTYSYDVAQELTSLQTTQGSSTIQNLSLSYNNDGDRTGQTDSVSNTQTTFGYDQADRLISFTKGSTSASYSYNGDGLRMGKTVNGTNSAEAWDLSEGLPLMIQDGTTKYITGPGGLPVEQVDGSGHPEYYLQDQLGSTRGLIDSSGNVVGQYTFDAWGNPQGHWGASTPSGYAGQYTDTESGLQYLQARYYDPSTQQFLTADPLQMQTMEPYSYVVDSPLNAQDPSGLCATNRGRAAPLFRCGAPHVNAVFTAVFDFDTGQWIVNTIGAHSIACNKSFKEAIVTFRLEKETLSGWKPVPGLTGRCIIDHPVNAGETFECIGKKIYQLPPGTYRVKWGVAARLTNGRIGVSTQPNNQFVLTDTGEGWAVP